MAQCNSCKAQIEWVTMLSGKKMPLDIKMATVVIEADDGRYEVISARTPHFATCPNAAQHRKGKS